MSNKKRLNKDNFEEAYKKLIDIVSSNSFLNNQGLNNEVPFHICPYKPSIQNQINRMIVQFKNDLEEKKVNLLEINLYDLAIETLKEEEDWDWLLEEESSLSRERLKEELQGILDIETVIIPSIVKKTAQQKFEVLLITGVGEVFPYIRSHNILNNLQKHAKDKPTLMLFPGEFQHSLENGASLILFGKLPDDKYYRAFNILDRAI